MRAQIGRGRSSHRGDDSSHLALEIVMPRGTAVRRPALHQLGRCRRTRSRKRSEFVGLAGLGMFTAAKVGWAQRGSRRFDRGPERQDRRPMKASSHRVEY